MGYINRHRDRIFARVRRPTFFREGQGLSIDLHDPAAVDEIHVDHPVARGLTVLRFAAERNRRDACPSARVNDGRGVGIAVERKHALRYRVVDDRIRVVCRGDSEQ